MDIITEESFLALLHRPEIYIRRKFFERDTATVAREIIGATLVVLDRNDGILAARIVETEAYLPLIDEASHSFRGKTARNQAMFGDAGSLYVYRIYGSHLCANIVTEAEGKGAAILLRAGEPLIGITTMRKRRATDNLKNLCSGPGKLSQSFGFCLDDNSRFLCCSPQEMHHSQRSIALLASSVQPDIGVSSRVGISKGVESPLRFFAVNNPFVSKGKPSA